ncbi:hypothetical protein C8J57DRAFT_1514073 [Mycena rebaudengoi]|nr:hypothetical protein C8J57DRAFT_1514073 [Mycena rebaudengoi]
MTLNPGDFVLSSLDLVAFPAESDIVSASTTPLQTTCNLMNRLGLDQDPLFYQRIITYIHSFILKWVTGNDELTVEDWSTMAQLLCFKYPAVYKGPNLSFRVIQSVIYARQVLNQMRLSSLP